MLIGSFSTVFNPLPNDKILDWSTLKGLSDKKLNVVQKWNFFYAKVENIVEIGKMVVPSIFSFPHKSFILGVVKSRDCVAKGLSHTHSKKKKNLTAKDGKTGAMSLT